MSLKKRLLIPALIVGGLGIGGTATGYAVNESRNAVRILRETPELKRLQSINAEQRTLDQEIIYEDPNLLEQYTRLKQEEDSLNSLSHVIEAREELSGNIYKGFLAGILGFSGLVSAYIGFVGWKRRPKRSIIT